MLLKTLYTKLNLILLVYVTSFVSFCTDTFSIDIFLIIYFRIYINIQHVQLLILHSSWKYIFVV